MKPQKHIFKRSMWTDTTEVEMEGVRYTIPAAMTAKYVANETDLKNVPDDRSIFIYSSDEMSWQDISPLINNDEYSSLDWKGYAKINRKVKKLEEKVLHAWQMVLKLGEELELNDNASATAEEYRRAVESGDEDSIGKAINQVDITVKKYAALDVPIELEAELQSCYDDYLMRSGQKVFLEKLRGLADSLSQQ